MKLSAAAVSIVGNVRKINQDNFYIDNVIRPLKEQDFAYHCTVDADEQVFSVCDGMGGEEAGEEASIRAVEKLKEMPADYLIDHWKEYIDQANESVCQLCRERSIRAGTTFAGVFFQAAKCTAVNVGDSRIYLVSKGSIRQISIDHTQFQTMVKAGLIEETDQTHSKARSQLTQHLGLEKELLELEPYVIRLNNLEPGDTILLCSDGLYGVVSDEEMLSIIQSEENIQQCCDLLVNRAQKAGSRDNVTAMLIRVEDVSSHTSESKRKAGAANDTSGGSYVLPFITIALGLFSVALIMLLVRFAYTWPMVSDMTGQTVENAKKTLENNGFQVILDGDLLDESEVSFVIAQSIPGNVRAKRGSEITLALSNGAEGEEQISEEESEESELDEQLDSGSYQLLDSIDDTEDSDDNLADIWTSKDNSFEVSDETSNEYTE